MEEKVVYVLESPEIESTLIDEIKNNENYIIIPLNHNLAKFLQRQKFDVIMEEQILNLQDYELIDKTSLALSGGWYEENTNEKLEYHGVDISNAFQQELNQIFLRLIHRIILFERISKKFNIKLIKFFKTDVIIDSILKKILEDNKIDYQNFYCKNNENILNQNKFEQVNFSVRIFGKNKDVQVSKKTFRVLKYFFEKYWDLRTNIQNISKDYNREGKNSILFVDFNLTLHENFLRYLSEKEYNLLFLNNRRTIIWNKKSLKISNEINFKKIKSLKMKSYEKNLIDFKNYKDKIEKNFLDDKFEIENHKLGDFFKKIILEILEKRLFEIISKIDEIEKLIKLEKIDFVWVLDDWGEDRILVEAFQHHRIPVFFFLSGSLAVIKLKNLVWPLPLVTERIADKLIIWGENDFQNCLEMGVQKEKIEIGGAPRYDKFNKITKSDENYILILVGGFPSTSYSYFLSTSFLLNFEKKINSVFSALKKFDKKIILKRHPTQGFNEILDYEKMILNIIPNAIVLKEADTIKLISKASLVISVPTTALEETILLDKPVILIPYLDEDEGIPYWKSGAALKIENLENISQIINDCLYDEVTREKLKDGRKNFIKKVFHNENLASKSHEDRMLEFLGK